MNAVLLAWMSTARCRCLARETALTVLFLGTLAAHTAHAASPPGVTRIEGHDDTVVMKTLHNSLSHAGDSYARRFSFADPREAVTWRSLDGADAAELRKASIARRDSPADVDRLVVLASLRPLTNQWTRSPNWVQTLDSVRRQGIPLLRPASNSGMAVSLGVSRHGIPGVYLVQKIAP